MLPPKPSILTTVPAIVRRGRPKHPREQPQRRRGGAVLEDGAHQPRHPLLRRALQPVAPAKAPVECHADALHPRSWAPVDGVRAVGFAAPGLATKTAISLEGAVAEDERVRLRRATRTHACGCGARGHGNRFSC